MKIPAITWHYTSQKVMQKHSYNQFYWGRKLCAKFHSRFSISILSTLLDFHMQIILKGKNIIQGSSWQEIFLTSADLQLKKGGSCSQSETLLLSSLGHYPPGMFSRKTPKIFTYYTTDTICFLRTLATDLQSIMIDTSATRSAIVFKLSDHTS